jgi:RimJ/RimL family protein N-acetyltransferase
MALSLHGAAHRVPYEFRDKNGRTLHLRKLDVDLHEALLGMYLAFQPRNCFQGLPPIRDEVCTRWVHDMVRDAVNLVVCDTGLVLAGPDKRDARPTVLGHAALFPINDEKCEMLVVVSPDHQNHGAGTALVRACIRTAEEQGFQRIWLPVAATNVRARHVYEKCGFEYVSRGLSRELEMARELQPCRPMAVEMTVLDQSLTAIRPVLPRHESRSCTSGFPA